MPVLLVVTASPDDQDRLALTREVKLVKQALTRSRNREDWRLESAEAATVDDLRRAILDSTPTIVHFSGHGGGESGLFFEDDQGLTHPVQSSALAKLFHIFKEQIKCVVLNACYSKAQADSISQEIDYVIGMSSSIEDEAAIRFSVAFYDGIFAGTTFKTAFELGCTAIDLQNLAEADIPIFKTGPAHGGLELAYSDYVRHIEDTLLAYWNSPAESRHLFTTKGENLKETINSHYSDRMLVPASEVKVLSQQKIDDEHIRVLVSVNPAGQSTVKEYYVRISGRDVKVDWEASVGHWSMPIVTYLALGTSTRVVARVTAILGDDYYGYFSEKAFAYQSVILEDINGKTLYGYIHRQGEKYQELMEVLSDGNPHKLVLAIVNRGNETEHPIILGILSIGWIYDCEDADD